MTSQHDDREEHRARILAMTPEDRAALAELMLRQRNKIPGEIAALQAEMRDLDEWLVEFAPELAPHPDQQENGGTRG